MKKYIGLILLAALASATLLAAKAAPDDKQRAKGSAINESQISQLDKRLSERIAEQQQLLAMVEKILGINFTHKDTGAVELGNILSGQAKPPPAPPAPTPIATVAPVKVAEPPPPWWQSYRPKMVYLSGNDRYAVVNGKMVTSGQTLGNDVVVDKIEDEAVVLRLGTESHTYPLKK